MRSRLVHKARAAVVGLALLPLGGLVAACGSSHSSSPAPSSAPSGASSSTAPKVTYTVGFSNPQGTQPVLDDFQQALTLAGQRVGIKVISLNAALSVANQVSDIQQFINDKVNAIVVFPLAGPPLVPVLSAARKAGIVVLGYNAVTSPVTSAAQLYPYSADLNQGLIHEGAALAAAFVARELHGRGNVLGVGIAAPVPALHAFMAAEQADVTAGHPGIRWLETVSDQTDDIAGAAAPVADALTRYHDQVSAVMAYFDGAAIGAAESLRAAGVKAVVVGQQGNTDGIAAIRSGEISATINVMPYEQALIAITMLRDLLSGRTVPLIVHPPVQLVSAANLSQYVPWATGLAEIASGKLTPPATVSATPSLG